LGAQGVEIDLVVASQFEMFDVGAPSEDVEGDVEDVVGLVIGEVAFEEVKVAVDVTDQAGPARDQEHGAETTGTEAVDAAGEFVVDVGSSHHGVIAFGAGAVLDAIEDSLTTFAEDLAVSFSGLVALVFPGFARDSRSHSKTSVVWNSEDVFSPLLFQKFRGFSSFLPDSCLDGRQITLG
jgi:hypothetical protein